MLDPLPPPPRREVWKYPVKISADQTLMVPPGRFRFFGHQDGGLMVWFEVAVAGIPEPVRLAVIGTGHRVPEDSTYLGTTQVEEYVWHLYGLSHHG